MELVGIGFMWCDWQAMSELIFIINPYFRSRV